MQQVGRLRKRNVINGRRQTSPQARVTSDGRSGEAPDGLVFTRKGKTKEIQLRVHGWRATALVVVAAAVVVLVWLYLRQRPAADARSGRPMAAGSCSE